MEQDTGDAGETADGKEVVESGYSSEKHNTGESDGTSPSSMAVEGGGEAAEATEDVVATCAPPPGWTAGAQSPGSTEDCAPFQSPDHGDCDPGCNAQTDEDGSDEELRITIPENGEGSIHISPVEGSERPESRCGFANEDSRPRGTSLLELCRSLAGVEIGGGNCNGVSCTEEAKSEFKQSNQDTERKQVCQKPADAENEGQSNGEESNGDSGTVGHPSNKNECTENDVSEWCKTLASKQQTEEGECSVISCLNQFTSLELMTGNNKVGCDACTQRQNKGKFFPLV